MTVPAGFDIAAIGTGAPVLANTSQGTGGAPGKGKVKDLLALGNPVHAEGASASFRDGFEALLSGHGSVLEADLSGTGKGDNISQSDNLIKKDMPHTLMDENADASLEVSAQDRESAVHAVPTKRTYLKVSPDISVSYAGGSEHPSSGKAARTSFAAKAHPEKRENEPAKRSTTISQPLIVNPGTASVHVSPAPAQQASQHIAVTAAGLSSHSSQDGNTPAVLAALSSERIHSSRAMVSRSTVLARHETNDSETTAAFSEPVLDATHVDAAPSTSSGDLHTTSHLAASHAEKLLAGQESLVALAKTQTEANNATGKTIKPTEQIISASNTIESTVASKEDAKSRVSSSLQHEPSLVGTAQPSGNVPAAQAPFHASLMLDHAEGQPAIANRSSAAPVAAPESRDAFAALDSAPNMSLGHPDATWLHANARHAEAGFLDPSLGWVSVRADATPAGLHASVVPSSAEAAQTLSHHLAGLNSYLAENHGRAISTSLAAPESAPDMAGQGRQSASGQQQGNRQQQEQRGTSASFVERSTSRTVTPALSSIPEPVTFSTTHPGGISVLA